MNTILYFRPSPASHADKVAGVLEIAEKAHIHVQIIDEPPDTRRLRPLLAFWKCSGVIVECGGRRENVDPSAFGSLPTVFFNYSLKDLPPRCFAVGHDSRSTGQLAARELLLSGASNFAYLPAPSDCFWSRERKAGFSEALALNGKRCIEFVWPAAHETVTQRTKALRRFLKEVPKPCEILAANDALAAEAIAAARLSDIAIPDEIAILGVDNAVDVCEHTNPTLSSIEPDFRRGGNLAMIMLLALMRGRGHFRGAHHRTFGDLGITHRLSTKRLLRPDRAVAQALDLIGRKACDGIRASEVLHLFPCSRRMADLRFRRAVGHTVLEEIHDVRLTRVKQLLLSSNISLKALSDFCGFRHPNSLRKFFRAKTGMTLGEWRRQPSATPRPTSDT